MAKKTNEFTNEPKVVATGKTETSGHEIFTLVTKDGVTMIAVANKIVSKMTFPNEKEAKKYIDSKPWELLVNVSCVCFDLMSNNQNNK